VYSKYEPSIMANQKNIRHVKENMLVLQRYCLIDFASQDPDLVISSHLKLK